MPDWFAKADEALSARWKVVDAGYELRGVRCEDTSIVTEDDREVVGCSEWLRADHEVLAHICEIHNEWLAQQTGEAG